MCYLPQWKLFGTLIMAHHEGSRIPVSNELVVFAAIYLHLVLIEEVQEVAGGDVEREIEDIRIVDREGPIREMLSFRLGHGRRDPLRCEAIPNRRQLFQNQAVAVTLGRYFAGEMLEPVCTGEETVEIVKAAIFGVYDHNVFNLVDARTFPDRQVRSGDTCAVNSRCRRQERAQNPFGHEILDGLSGARCTTAPRRWA